MGKFKSLLFVIVFVLLVSPLTSFADAWSPVDSGDYTDKICLSENIRPINIFINNFVEANVYNYSSNSSDSVIIDTVLKHTELNGRVAAINIDGKTYMEISKEKFDNLCRHLFAKTVSIDKCPGYNSTTNTVMVSADCYKPTIHNFAPLNNCVYNGNKIYTFYFNIYRVDNAGNYYSQNEYTGADRFSQISSPVGSGKITAKYIGNGSSFTADDFAVSNITITNNSPEYTNSNVSLSNNNSPENDGSNTADVSSEKENATLEELNDSTPTPLPQTNSASSSFNIFLIVIIGIILISMSACVVLLILILKRK